MTAESPDDQGNAALLPCPSCGTLPGSEDRDDVDEPSYCSICNLVICPFCRSTDDCEHVVGFDWGGDHFAHTSLDAEAERRKTSSSSDSLSPGRSSTTSWIPATSPLRPSNSSILVATSPAGTSHRTAPSCAQCSMSGFAP